MFVWHDEDDAAPDFEVPFLPELTAGWSPPCLFRRRLKARFVDAKENIVDFAHFPVLHRAAVMDFARPLQQVQRRSDAASLQMEVESESRLFGFPIHSRIRFEFDLHGPGIEEARVVSPAPLLLRFLTTPIDHDWLDIVVLVYSPPSRVPLLPPLQARLLPRWVAREAQLYASELLPWHRRRATREINRPRS